MNQNKQSHPAVPTASGATGEALADAKVMGSGFYRNAKPGTFGRCEFLDLLMACQDGRATCMRALEIIEREMDSRSPSSHELAEAFLRWPLPESVCADLCATKQGPGRVGTNLLSYSEAKQMFEQLLSAPSSRPAVAQEGVTHSKPCPFCGDTRKPDIDEIVMKFYPPNLFSASCQCCGTQGPLATTRLGAQVMWDTRLNSTLEFLKLSDRVEGHAGLSHPTPKEGA